MSKQIFSSLGQVLFSCQESLLQSIKSSYMSLVHYHMSTGVTSCYHKLTRQSLQPNSASCVRSPKTWRVMACCCWLGYREIWSKLTRDGNWEIASWSPHTAGSGRLQQGLLLGGVDLADLRSEGLARVLCSQASLLAHHEDDSGVSVSVCRASM